MVNWENTEYVNPRQRKMKDLETGKIYTFEIQDDPDNILKQSQTPVRAENLNKMQTDLVDDMSKNYTGTNITANTVEGFGTINKLYGDTVQTGTGDKSPDNSYIIKSIGDIMLSSADLENGSSSSVTGENIDATNRVRTKELLLLKAGTYTLLYQGASKATIHQYNTSNTFIESLVIWTSGCITFTLTQDSKVKFVFGKSDDSNMSPADITNIQLTGKSKIEVKSSNNSNTSSNVTYTGKPLCCLKDGEGNIVLQDYIDYKRGKVVRQCGYKILNGSESWYNGGLSEWTNSSHLFWTKIDDFSAFDYNISNQFTLDNISTVVHSTTKNHIFAMYNYNSSYNIVFLDKNSADANAFKQKLAKNNMILVYKLATPIEEDIECTDKIVQYEGSTTIQSDAKIDVTLNNNKAISQIYENIEDTYKRNTKNQVVTDNFSASTGTIQSLYQYRNEKYVTVMLNIKFSSTAGQYLELGRLKLKPIDSIAIPAPILNHQSADGYTSCNTEMLFTGNDGIIALRTLKAYTNAYARVYLTYLTDDVD